MSENGPMLRISGRRRWLGAFIAMVWTLGFTSFPFSAALAQDLSVQEAEQLVRSFYYEGIPEDEARRVGPAAAARLIEMLNDSAESAAHANILMVLGMCRQPGAYEALSDWASRRLEGEIDRNAFRAWQVLPYALGHVAEADARAVTRLEELMDEETPTWTFRHHRGARLHHQARRAAVTALGMSGSPEAGRALERAARHSTDVDFDQHLRSARRMHAERSRGGRPQ